MNLSATAGRGGRPWIDRCAIDPTHPAVRRFYYSRDQITNLHNEPNPYNTTSAARVSVKHMQQQQQQQQATAANNAMSTAAISTTAGGQSSGGVESSSSANEASAGMTSATRGAIKVEPAAGVPNTAASNGAGSGGSASGASGSVSAPVGTTEGAPAAAVVVKADTTAAATTAGNAAGAGPPLTTVNWVPVGKGECTGIPDFDTPRGFDSYTACGMSVSVQ